MIFEARLPLLLIAVASLDVSSATRDDEAPAKWTQEELERAADEIRLEIQQLRQQQFERPVAVELADGAQFQAYAKQRVAKTETAESLAADETIAKLLGLIPADMDLLGAQMKMLEGQVGGFYDPGADKFYLMETFTGDVARVILSHELTHALDDQHYDIDGTLAGTGGATDAELAFHAVVEGSGTATMMGWILEHRGEIDMAAVMKAQDLSAGLEDAPPLLWKPLIAVYVQGMQFLQQGRAADEQAFLARAFEHPPRSTEQVLHPEKYWDEEQLDEPRAIDFDTEALPEGWQVLAEDTLGELMLALVVMPMAERGGLDPLMAATLAYTGDATEGWGGDRVLLVGNGDARALRLVTVWDTPEDARQFAAALDALLAEPIDAGWQGRLTRKSSTGSHEGRAGQTEHVVIDVRLGEAAAALEELRWSEGR